MQSEPGGAETSRVLCVEDEPDIRRLVVRLLAESGYEVYEAEDAFTAVQQIAAKAPDLILLDVMLPDVDGIELLTRLRRDSSVPVILLTGKGAEDERIQGLRQGADDYIVKPFSPGELIARVESVLRRAGQSGAHQATTSLLTFEGLEIDVASRDVRVKGAPIELTAREFDLLAFMARSPRQVFSREQLLQHVWSSSSDWQDSATVTEHVRRVRRKIEDDPDRPRWVLTVRGVGYRFDP
jgi:DNA-binding response OmpR family regulator